MKSQALQTPLTVLTHKYQSKKSTRPLPVDSVQVAREKQKQLTKILETHMQQQNWKTVEVTARQLHQNTQKIVRALKKQPKLAYLLEVPELA